MPTRACFGTTTGLGFGYSMNRLGMAILDDVRSRNLREAVVRCAG